MKMRMGAVIRSALRREDRVWHAPVREPARSGVMAQITRIVTHPGGAHKDDLLAVCVLVAEHGCPVERREPTPEELADPLVAVIDVGASDDASLANFDHHQYPREHAPTCALSLVLQAMGLYDDAKKLCDWLEPAEWFDSRGPNKTAQWLGVPRRAVSQLNSPIDMTLLRRFAASSHLAPGETLYEFMRYVGEDLLSYLREAQARIRHVSALVERWNVSTDSGGDLGVVFLPRTEPAVEEPSGSLGGYVRVHGLEAAVAALVYPDRRGGGYGIARYEDHPQLDFSRVEGEADVHFAHKSGFMCKTSATEPRRLRELVSKAVLPLQNR